MQIPLPGAEFQLSGEKAMDSGRSVREGTIGVRMRLGDLLVRIKLVSEEDIAKALARQAAEKYLAPGRPVQRHVANDKVILGCKRGAFGRINNQPPAA